jgi:uncharacterized membrane protein
MDQPQPPIQPSIRLNIKRPWESVFDRLRRYLLTGVVVTVPVFLTLYIAWIFLLYVDSLVTPLIPQAYNPNHYLNLPFAVPGVGLVLVLIFFVIVGWVTRNFLGRWLFGIPERIVSHLPVISPVYKGIKQVFETLMSGNARAFREVVLFEFPSPGMWTLGFVTGVPQGELQFLPDDELVSILLLMAINPTSATLLFIPRKKLRTVNMTVDQALKMIISGALVPPPEPGPSTTLLRNRS